jgi:hypothetical protein
LTIFMTPGGSSSPRCSFLEADIGTVAQHFDPFDAGNAGRNGLSLGLL